MNLLPFQLSPVYRSFRKCFFCRYGKHEIITQGYNCLYCGILIKPFPQWEVSKPGNNPIIVSAYNEHHAVICALQLNYGVKLHDSLYHVFMVQPFPLVELKAPVSITVDDNMIFIADSYIQTSK